MKTLTAEKQKNGWLVKMIDTSKICKNREEVIHMIMEEKLVVLMGTDEAIYATDENISIKRKIDNRTEDQIFQMSRKRQ